MVPRTEIIGFEVNATLEEVMTTVSEERYTRYPIFENDRDNILGFLNIKDLLTKEESFINNLLINIPLLLDILKRHQ